MAKRIDKTTIEMRKLLTDKKLIIGRERTIKRLREGKLARVLIAANCAAQMRESLERYCKQSKVQCIDLPQLGSELGVMCKKPFAISVIGVLK